jgi:hypothetical protein
VLQVIQHQQQILLAQVTQDLLLRVLATLERIIKGVCQSGQQKLDRTDWRQRYKIDPVGKGTDLPLCCLQRQAGLANAAGADQGQQSPVWVCQQLGQIFQFLFPTNKGSGRGWQVVQRR